MRYNNFVGLNVVTDQSAGKENQRLAVAGIFFAALFSFLFVSGTFASLTFTGTAITGDASSTIDVGSGNTLLLQTTNNGPLRTGTGLFTIGGNMTVASGTTLGSSSANTVAVNGTIIGIAPLVFSGSAGLGSFSLTFSITVPTANRTVTFADASGTVITTGNLSSITSVGTLGNMTSTGQVFGNTVVASSSFAVGNGTAIAGHLSATNTLGFGTISTQTCRSLGTTVSGASIGDTVAVGAPVGTSLPAGVTWTGYVSTTDTVNVRVCNIVAGSVTVATDTWRMDIWKH